MAERIHIDPDLARAIKRNANYRGFDSYARKNYGISGKKLLARLVAGEGGGQGLSKRDQQVGAKLPGVSSAGARGPAQFIPSTREGYKRQYGLDPWKNNDQAIKSAIIHIEGTGLAGYNPGMSTYTDYILGQRTTGVGGAGRGQYKRNGRRGGGGSGPTSVSLAGVDNSAARQQLFSDYLSNKGQPGALLGLLTGLKAAEDLPGSSLTVPGRPGRRRGGSARGPMLVTGEPVGKLLSRAVKWDRAQAPYAWGGGHGSTAKPGQPVDCSGFWSGILNLKTPLTSGDFMSWGKPGPGKHVTIYTHEGHIIGKIKDPRTGKWRWFGTSKSNPGGGAGEIKKPSASYLASFVQRHPGR